MELDSKRKTTVSDLLEGSEDYYKRLLLEADNLLGRADFFYEAYLLNRQAALVSDSQPVRSAALDAPVCREEAEALIVEALSCLADEAFCLIPELARKRAGLVLRAAKISLGLQLVDKAQGALHLASSFSEAEPVVVDRRSLLQYEASLEALQYIPQVEDAVRTAFSKGDCCVSLFSISSRGVFFHFGEELSYRRLDGQYLSTLSQWIFSRAMAEKRFIGRLLLQRCPWAAKVITDNLADLPEGLLLPWQLSLLHSLKLLGYMPRIEMKAFYFVDIYICLPV